MKKNNNKFITSNICLLLICFKVFAQAPLVHYSFDGNPNDISGNSNHAIPMGATLTTDRFGSNNSAYYFDGLDDYLALTNPLVANNFTDKITISLWVNVMGNGTNYPRLVIGGRVNETFTFCFISNNANEINGILWRPKGGGYGGVDVISPVIFTLNTWHHLVAVYDGTKASIYIDGVKNVESNTSGNIPVETTFQGAVIGGETLAHEGGFFPSWFNGKLDDVRVYNRALPECEILSIYNGNNSCNTNNLVAHYPFCGNANDVSGNNYHGIVNGATLTANRFGTPNSAYKFDGITNNIEVPFTEITKKFSVSIWFKPETGILDNSYSGPITFLNTSDFQVFNPIIMGPDYGPSLIGKTAVCTRPNTSFSYQTCAYESEIMPLDQWHHFVYTFDKDDMLKIYRNGVLTASQDVNYDDIDNVLTKIVIGTAACGPNCAFKGDIDDIKIYERVLSDTEILALYSESDISCCGAILIPTITGTATACVNSTKTYTVTNVPGNTYTWSAAGGTVSAADNQADITWDAVGTQYVYLTAANECGISADTLTVEVSNTCPIISGNIIGSSSVLPGGTYSYKISPIVNATSYVWLVPADATILYGQNTDSIVVQYGTAGTFIAVKAINDCSGSYYKYLPITGLTAQTPPANGVINLTSMCSDNPAATRRWRVRNNSAVAYLVRWDVVGAGQTGFVLAAPNTDTFFETLAVSGPNTTRIWVGTKLVNTKASGGATCATPQPAQCYILGTGGRQEADMYVINEVSADINIYPNPSTGIINVAGGAVGDAIQIFDAMGKVVYSNIITAARDIEVSIDIAGIYLVKVGAHCQKFVIE
ncbi:MAG: LamG-like jellyroll fold domain-containing protein [Cytophagales bacterium]|nr:LamG-like jellyroll fold domain-containing protein [Cytophagales bacterium]